MTVARKKTSGAEPRKKASKTDGGAAPPTAAERLKRLLFLVPYVARDPDGVPLETLAAELDVPKRELLAEIDLLCRVGPPAGDPSEFLLLSVEGGRVRVDLPQKLVRPPRLSVQEAYALLLGAKALEGSGVSAHTDAVARAVAKIRTALGKGDERILARLESDLLFGTDDRAGSGVVAELAQAAEQKRAVEIEYYSAGRGASARRGVDPYGLVNHMGVWYLVGRCHLNDEPRIFKCERIASARTTDRTFTVPPDFDLARFQADRLRLPVSSRGGVRLRFTGEAAAQAKSWEGGKERAGGVEVALDLSPNEWLVGWVLGFGAECQVVAPDDLRQAVISRLRALAAAHG